MKHDITEQMRTAMTAVPGGIAVYRVSVRGKSGPHLLTARYRWHFEGINLVWAAVSDPFAKIKVQPPNWPHRLTEFSMWSFRIGASPEEAWKLFLDAKNKEANVLIEKTQAIERLIVQGNRRSAVRASNI